MVENYIKPPSDGLSEDGLLDSDFLLYSTEALTTHQTAPRFGFMSKLDRYCGVLELCVRLANVNMPLVYECYDSLWSHAKYRSRRSILHLKIRISPFFPYPISTPL